MLEVQVYSLLPKLIHIYWVYLHKNVSQILVYDQQCLEITVSENYSFILLQKPPIFDFLTYSQIYSR